MSATLLLVCVLLLLLLRPGGARGRVPGASVPLELLLLLLLLVQGVVRSRAEGQRGAGTTHCVLVPLHLPSPIATIVPSSSSSLPGLRLLVTATLVVSVVVVVVVVAVAAVAASRRILEMLLLAIQPGRAVRGSFPAQTLRGCHRVSLTVTPPVCPQG